MAPRAALGSALILLAAACGPSEDHLSDLEFHHRLDLLRRGTGATDRRLQLASVTTFPARTSVARDAQSACGTAYRTLLDAEDRITLAELQVKTAEATRAPMDAALQEVAHAEKLLADAKAAMPACDAAAARLAIAAR